MSKLAILGGQPTCNLKPNYSSGNPELERKYLLEAYDSGMWDNWPGMESQAEKFRREFAEFCGAKYCVMITNGTHTLQLALEAMEIGAGDEVIVPGITWQATASTVCDVNAVPVLVDIDPDTFCMDANKVEKAITPRTKAIVPVHLYGCTADMDRILEIAAKHNLRVLEDCAHAHGTRWDGKGIGTLGSIGSFSFQRSKTMTSGEGGALVTNDETLYKRIESMRMCGRPTDGVGMHSGNYRYTSFQAGVLRGQLDWMIKTGATQIDAFQRNFDKTLTGLNIPGIHPLRRNPHVTRQCGYGVNFRYDPKKWGGLTGWTFRKTMMAETGIVWASTYEPLNNTELYRPHTKKRHQLSATYVKKITPSRFKLPQCQKAFHDTCMLLEWRFALSPQEKLNELASALSKVWENRKELLDAQKKGIIG